MSSALHSIAFPKNYKLNDMISFLNNNNIKPIKPIDVYQPNYNRVRVRDPKLFDHFTTKILPDGIHLIIGWYKSMKGGASNKPKKIYYGAQRDLKKTERRPTQTEAWQAHQIRYWGLNQIHQGLKEQGYPTPKKILKEIQKYKNMVVENPDKIEKYYKFMDDKEAQLKEAENNLKLEEERLIKEKNQLLENEKILQNDKLKKEKELNEDANKKKAKPDLSKAATKIQSLVRMRKAKKQLEALKKAKIEATKKKDITLETLTDKAKSIIYNAIYLVPYEYRKKYEELIPRIKLSKGYQYPVYNENMFKSPDELVPIMDEIYNENNLIANIKKLLY